MSAYQFTSIVFGTIFIFFVLGGMFLFVRYVRNQYFPKERGDKLERAMMEMQILQARLEAKAEEGERVGAGEEGDEGTSGAQEEAEPPGAEPAEEESTEGEREAEAPGAKGEEEEEDPAQRPE